LAVNVGKPAVLMERRDGVVLSGIRKHRLPDVPVVVGTTNIEGDGQADLVNHGGRDKAVYVYPSEHFPLWKDEIGYDGGDSPFGENLTISGMLEDEARIGDIWQWGEVKLQISQPRWPCFKLAHRTGHLDMIRRLVDSNRSGWYMRVLQPGTISADTPVELVKVDPAGISVRQAFRALINRTSLDDEARDHLTSHPALSQAWRDALSV
jgi:MOSC domain-containing protein YiiM